MWARGYAREGVLHKHTNRPDISLSHKHEECDIGMASGLLDQSINKFTLKGLIWVRLFSNYSNADERQTRDKKTKDLLEACLTLDAVVLQVSATTVLFFFCYSKDSNCC